MRLLRRPATWRIAALIALWSLLIPASAASRSDIVGETRSASVAAPTSTSSVIGEVRDGRNKTATTVVPDGLPPVSGAQVSIPALGMSTTTDSAGRFRFDNVSVTPGAPYQKIAVEVSQAGFGMWQISGAPVRPGGNYLSLFVELLSTPTSTTYVPPEERARLGTGAVLPAPPVATNAGSTGGRMASPLAAGCSGTAFTGYQSQTMPPGSIRVFRRSLGRIDLVNFLFYVKHVLPNEWFANDDPQALQAGAIAVKMYGWQRVNSANAYGGTFNGSCYDVDDTQTYQVYDPSVSAGSTDNAVATSWPAVVYRAGTVLEALYQNAASLGATTNCVRWDGLRMVQEGSQSCATVVQQPENRTLKWFEILQRFYDNISVTFMGAGPAVTAPQSQLRIDVFVRGSDGQIHQKYWDCSVTPCATCWANCWAGPASMGTLGPGAVSDPAAAWSNNMTRLDVAVRGNDNALWVDTFQSSVGWSGWTSLGGVLSAGPGMSAQRNFNQVDILWRDSTNTIQRTSYNGSWTYQGALPALPTTPDASAVWDPAVTWRRGTVYLDAFVSSNDDGQQIYESTWNGATWSTWAGRGSGSDPAPPVGGNQARPGASAKAGSDRMDLFVRGSSTTLQWRSWNGSTWGAWTDLGTPTPNQIDSGGGATWWQNDGELDAFVRGADGHLYQKQSTDGLNWGGWNDLGAYP